MAHLMTDIRSSRHLAARSDVPRHNDGGQAMRVVIEGDPNRAGGRQRWPRVCAGPPMRVEHWNRRLARRL